MFFSIVSTCGELGEGVVHDGLDESGHLLSDLRLDLVDDQLIARFHKTKSDSSTPKG